MWTILISILTRFGTYMVSSLLVRVSSLVVFTTIGSTLISSLLNRFTSELSGVGQFLWFMELAGFPVALSSIGSALLLRATMNAWSLKPGSAITGGRS
ncbi:DUF2523 domain-containing protein [Kushneria aurantia]|uniref:DUF2523 domain-containing protein n=1 Tax=Kushneria aurantia TaxID=504092 RepID=A0ABV6G2U4_9GAMM|nr:DUF2523 domain-containing protein [Kushneria aurantia]